MSDDEIIAALRAQRVLSAVEMAKALDRLTNGKLGQGTLVTYFKRAFPSIPLKLLMDCGAWIGVGGMVLSDQEFNDLLGPHLPLDRLPDAAKRTIVRVVELLAAGDFAELETSGWIGRVTADGLRETIKNYGRTLVPLPEGAMDRAQVYPIDGAPGEWAVDLPLWTAEEGESDLALQLDVKDDGNGVRVAIDDLHVP